MIAGEALTMFSTASARPKRRRFVLGVTLRIERMYIKNHPKMDLLSPKKCLNDFGTTPKHIRKNPENDFFCAVNHKN